MVQHCWRCGVWDNRAGGAEVAKGRNKKTKDRRVGSGKYEVKNFSL